MTLQWASRGFHRSPLLPERRRFVSFPRCNNALFETAEGVV
jgi:hypothetical protein